MLNLTLLKSPNYSFTEQIAGRDKRRDLYSVMPEYIFQRNKQGGYGERI